VRNAALLLGSCLLVGLGAEWVLRAFPTPYAYGNMRNIVQQECSRPDPDMQYVNKENYTGTFSNREFSTQVRINAKGLRDRDVPYERTGRKRVLLVGDSFVFGWGVEAEESVAKQMESRLEDVEVINGGCSGWSTVQELRFLERVGFRYHPDVVLLFFVENDPFENFFRYHFEDGRLMLDVPRQTRTAAAVRWLQRRSALANLVAQWGHAGSAWWPGALPGSEIWPAEEGYLREFQKASAEQSVDFAIVYVPPKDRVGAPTRGAFYRKVHTLCAELSVPFVDLGPALSEAHLKCRVYFRLDDHWTRDGHRVAARAVSAFLVHEGWLDGRGGALG
jgi:lysophospholipase L1-like esterase